ncbi:MAG: homocysteine S-methyltransferase family protein [Bryobacteraceae bacterium]
MNKLQAELTRAIEVKPLVFEGAYDPNLAQFQDLVVATQSNPASDLQLSLSHPELIRRMHQDYVAAGCDVLQTFSWGLHPTFFDPPVGDDKIAQAARRDAEIAGEVAGTNPPTGRRRWVAGIVPAGVPLSLKKTTVEAAQSAARLVAGALISGGADLLVLALQTSIVDAMAALDGVVQACEHMNAKPPILVSFEIGPVGHAGPAGLIFGGDLAQALATCESAGAFSVGVYLTTHPARLPEALFGSKVRRTHAHVFADAGYTEIVDGELQCSLGPKEYSRIVAEQAKRLSLGFIGGGWGLSPQHIHELRLEVDAIKR